MYNDILKIGPITVHGYGLMIGIGILVALLVGDYRAKKKGMDGDLLYGLTFVAVFFGFFAAKILFIITQWQGFLKNPMNYITGNGFSYCVSEPTANLPIFLPRIPISAFIFT